MRPLTPSNTDPQLRELLAHVRVFERVDFTDPEIADHEENKDRWPFRYAVTETGGRVLELNFGFRGGNVTEKMLLENLLLWFARGCTFPHDCRHDEDSRLAERHISEALEHLPERDKNRPRTPTAWHLGGAFSPLVVLAILENRLYYNPVANDRELAMRSVREAMGALWSRHLILLAHQKAIEAAVRLGRSA